MQYYKLRSGLLYTTAWCEDTTMSVSKAQSQQSPWRQNWKDLIRLGWMTSINHFPFEKKIFGVLKPRKSVCSSFTRTTEGKPLLLLSQISRDAKDWKLMLKIDSEIHLYGTTQAWIESKVTTMNPSSVQKKETPHFWLLKIAKLDAMVFSFNWYDREENSHP